MLLYSGLRGAWKHWQRKLVLATAIAITLIGPASIYSPLSAEQSEAELAPVCASVYTAIMANFADKNYLAMVHNYYLYSDLSEERAREVSVQSALKISKMLNDGELTEDALMGVAKMCSARFNIPLPLSLSRVIVPSYVTEAEAYAAKSEPDPAPVVTAAERSCIKANEDYKAALQTVPAWIEEAGPRYESNGLNSSKYYYTLGRMCDSMKVSEDAVGKSCGWALQPEKLDVCK